MAFAFALFGTLISATPTAAGPIEPNFASLIPLKPKTPRITPQEQIEWKVNVEEALALAKYLDAARPELTDGTASEILTVNCLTVVAQLDNALQILDREPTAATALTRVRAYRALLDVVSRTIERAESRGAVPPVTQKQVDQTLRFVYRHYRALFARVV